MGDELLAHGPLAPAVRRVSGATAHLFVEFSRTSAEDARHRVGWAK